MADLLTDQIRQDIRNAMKDVTDTFMKTPVTYHLSVDSVDRYNEDRMDEVFTDYNLLGLLEFGTNETDQKFTPDEDGAVNDGSVKVSFNLEDLAVQGLIVNDMPIFQAEKDYMTMNGIKYAVTYAALDGPLTKRAILVIVKGEKVTLKS